MESATAPALRYTSHITFPAAVGNLCPLCDLWRQEIQDRYRLMFPGASVLDLGACPGGWSEVAVGLVDPRTSSSSSSASEGRRQGGGLVVAVDMKEMAPIENVVFICGDFTDELVQQRVVAALPPRGVDVLLSDMSHDLMGDYETDHVRSMALCSQVLDFADGHCREGTTLLCKYFRGRDDRGLVARAKAAYNEVLLVKPKASRSESAEMYLLARKRKRTR